MFIIFSFVIVLFASTMFVILKKKLYSITSACVLFYFFILFFSAVILSKLQIADLKSEKIEVILETPYPVDETKIFLTNNLSLVVTLLNTEYQKVIRNNFVIQIMTEEESDKKCPLPYIYKRRYEYPNGLWDSNRFWTPLIPSSSKKDFTEQYVLCLSENSAAAVGFIKD